MTGIRPSFALPLITIVGLLGGGAPLALSQTGDVPVALSAPALVPAPGLTLGELEQMALQYNPTLAQAAAQVAAARGRQLQAGLYPNPTVGYSGEEMGVEGTAGEQGVFIDQMIVTGGKLRYARSMFGHEVTEMNWQAAAQQYRVLNGVRMRYWQVLALEQFKAVRGELLRLAEESVVTTEELLNVGQTNRPDLLQARAEARRARLALATAERQYEGAWRELVSLVGCPALPPRPLDGNLEQPGPEFQWEGTLAHLLQASPEVQVALARVARARCALAREQVEPIPNLNLRAGTAYNFESEGQQADVEAGLVLPLFDRNQGNIRSAAAELARAQSEVRRVRLSLEQRLARAFARYQAARQISEEYREAILPQESEAYRLYLESFRARRAPWSQVLVAQRSFFETSIEYVESLEELRRVEVALAGLLLVDGLGEPPGPGDSAERPEPMGEEPLGQPIGSREGRGLGQRFGREPAG